MKAASIWSTFDKAESGRLRFCVPSLSKLLVEQIKFIGKLSDVCVNGSRPDDDDPIPLTMFIQSCTPKGFKTPSLCTVPMGVAADAAACADSQKTPARQCRQSTELSGCTEAILKDLLKSRFRGSVQTANRYRPFVRRRFSTLRPSVVRMRTRKPCFLWRFLLLGWNVRFISGWSRSKN
jgi:hypothetical protein